MKTVQLYDRDGHLAVFAATVLDCEERGGGTFDVILDRTAFFPEGGGQEADTGTLGTASVTDVSIRDGVIRHRTTAPLAAGSEVEGRIDWEKRFRRMQCHTGEHLLSGAFHALYGLDNVGFHLGEHEMTLDLDGPLTEEQLRRAELLANEAVAKDLPVLISHPSAEELAALDYRSKLELAGDVRIVTVEGYDVCACCAPHVSHTGEIGIIKILDHIAYKGGIRMHVACGFRALDDYHEKYTQVKTIAQSLSVRQAEAADAVVRLKEELAEARAALGAEKRKNAALLADALVIDGENAVLFLDGADAETLRSAANRLAPRCSGVALCASIDGETCRYVASSLTVPMRDFAKTMHASLGGRGGGSDAMISGALPADRDAIEQFLKTK